MLTGFQVLESNREPLNTEDSIIQPVLNKKKNFFVRWEKTAILGWNTREFMVFIDHGIPGPPPIGVPPCAYIEEITGGHLEKIEDDSLWESLREFAESKGFLEVKAPPVNMEWFR